ncbi:B12-binding domain-containing radical SAM protein [Bacillus cereus]|uniref:B12-binding domain-containing radical SAM protein n=1 Tax=Bacillus cereus TaxID=1396 RepID=UPI00211377DA|nr:B12-binding domain-containing radical SAM protein [Bacillus cereus]
MRIVLTNFAANGYRLPPFGLGILASIALSGERFRPEDIIINNIRAEATVSNAVESIMATKPDVIGISCFVWNYNKVLRLVRRIRAIQSDVVIIVGGPHISKTDVELAKMFESRMIDIAVTGDGEVVFQKLNLLVGTGRRSLRGIVRSELDAPDGWLFGFMKEIDGIRNPYLFHPLFQASLKFSGTALVETSRGCPFACTFCDQGWRQMRSKNLDTVQSELMELVSNGARKVIFLDPTFNFHRARTEQLLKFITNNLPGLSIHAEIKAELLIETEMDLLAAIPNTSVEIGLQSSNKNTLQKIKRSINIDRLGISVQALSSRGINIIVNTIYGLPDECFEDWCRSLDFAYSLGENVIVTANHLRILPNTEMDYEKEKYGFLVDLKGGCRVLSTRSMTYKEINLAEKMSHVLSLMGQAKPSERKRFRGIIGTNFGGSLSRYLEVRTYEISNIN